MTPPDNYLFVGAGLFVLGAIGFLTRSNLILMMLSTELMLHGVSLNLVAFSGLHQNLQGQAFTVFVLTIAACEAGLALALILTLYRRRHTLDVGAWSTLREPRPVREPDSGPETPVMPITQPFDEPAHPRFPKLTSRWPDAVREY